MHEHIYIYIDILNIISYIIRSTIFNLATIILDSVVIQPCAVFHVSHPSCPVEGQEHSEPNPAAASAIFPT